MLRRYMPDLLNKFCIGCGLPFKTYDKRQKRCQHHCKRSRTEARKNRYTTHVEFIGVDGEGITYKDENRQTQHDYVLLSVGDKSFHKDGAVLTHEDIFSFLWQCHLENPRAVMVGFYLGYDFSQWFKSIPVNRAKMLISKQGIAARRRKLSGGNTVPFPVRINEWELDMLGQRRFKLRKAQSEDWKVKNTNSWLYVCDAGQFFQMSLLKAISLDKRKDKNGAPIPLSGMSVEEHEKLFAVIQKGKEERSEIFSWKQRQRYKISDEIVLYNTSENKALSLLMKELHTSLVEIGVRLKRSQWFGPGQAVQAWLKSVNAPTGEKFRHRTPKWAINACRSTYFGGWFEIPVHGIIPGTTHEYDINSAYPDVMRGLPCCLHGKWTQGKGNTSISKGYLIRYAKVTGNDLYLGTMPHRDKASKILRPHETIGWFWDHELQASKRAGLISKIVTYRWVHYKPCACIPPMKILEALYLKRLEVGKNTPLGKALKLIYNSAYGKFAQSIGEPKYGNAMYASLITAGCRVRILDAIATHPHKAKAVRMIATDGVYFNEKHPTLELDDEKLGAWSYKEKHNLSVFKPGVYWDDKSRKQLREGKRVDLQSRGISAKELGKRILEIDEDWKEFPKTQKWPELHIPVPFSVQSPVLALARNRWDECGYVSINLEFMQSSDPSHKRDISNIQIVDSMIRTRPHKKGERSESIPYDGKFGEEMREKSKLDRITGLDAPPKMEIQEMLE